MRMTRLASAVLRSRLEEGDLRELQTRPNSHLPARDAPKDQNKQVQIRAPKPSSTSSEQEQIAQIRTPSWKTPQRRTCSRRGVQIRVGGRRRSSGKPRFCRADLGWFFILVWQILGKLPANFSANSSGKTIQSIFGRVSPKFQAPQETTSRPKLSAFPLHLTCLNPKLFHTDLLLTGENSVFWKGRSEPPSPCEKV